MSFAFFDFDNTIIHGDAGPLFSGHLMEAARKVRGRVRLWARYLPYFTGMVSVATLYKVGAVRRSQVVRAAYRGLRGVPTDMFYEALDGFVATEIPPRIYPRIRAAMEAHQEAGDECVIITTGMHDLVTRALPFLPGDVELLGCHLDVRDGVFTGRVRGPLYGADKANIIDAYCQARDVDPMDCTAYTDHFSDKHMLEAVGRGVTVNPRGRLRSLAAKNDWDIWDLDDPRGPS